MPKGKLTTRITVSGDEQFDMDNYTMIPLRTANGDLLAASIRIQPSRNFQLPKNVESRKDLKNFLTPLLAPLREAGFDLELMIGTDE